MGKVCSWTEKIKSLETVGVVRDNAETVHGVFGLFFRCPVTRLTRHDLRIVINSASRCSASKTIVGNSFRVVTGLNSTLAPHFQSSNPISSVKMLGMSCGKDFITKGMLVRPPTPLFLTSCAFIASDDGTFGEPTDWSHLLNWPVEGGRILRFRIGSNKITFKQFNT